MAEKEKPLGLFIRLDKETLAEVERLADFETIDKTEWVRRAILDYIDESARDEADFMIQEYIQRRISENQLLEHFPDWKGKIPADIKKDREEYGKRKLEEYDKQ